MIDVKEDNDVNDSENYENVILTESDNHNGCELVGSSVDAVINHPEQDNNNCESKYEQLKATFADSKKEFEIQECMWNEQRLKLKEELLQHKEEAIKAKKDIETIVMRYATSEKVVLDLKKQNNNLTKQLEDINKEKQNLVKRIKVLDLDKCTLLAQVAAKEKDKNKCVAETNILKENLHSRDVKIKWLQNKNKTETDSLKECQSKLDKHVALLESAREQLRKAEEGCQIASRTHEANEASLKDQLSALQSCTELTLLRSVESERDDLKAKLQALYTENNTLSMKFQTLLNEKTESDKQVEILITEISALKTDLSEYEDCLTQLRELQKELKRLQSENDKYHQESVDLTAELDSVSEKLEQAVSRNGDLAERNVHLQSEMQSVSAERDSLKEYKLSSEHVISSVQSELKAKIEMLTKESETKDEEIQLLTNKLAVKSKKVQGMQEELSYAENENQILKKKHDLSVKEMSREVNLLYRKLNSNSKSKESLADSEHGSSSSLSNEEEKVQSLAVTYDNPCVEKIAMLQNSLASKNERIDLLEDTNKSLIKEIQKKSRLIQNYAMEGGGSLAKRKLLHSTQDLTDGAEVKPSEGMTLELSLEMNQKYQAVLEDILLQNITLKENMKTLGDEISKLKSQP